MNCFFVSCEIAENPELKGLAVAVASHNSDYSKGIVLAASYEARPYGVKSAMRITDALNLCPNLILVDPSMELYNEYSRLFFDYFLSVTPLVEPASIDEGFLDVTEVCRPEDAIQLANDIQKTLLEKYHLPCSIGIAPNKFLAKMASDMKKPQGITVLRKREVPEKLWPLSIKEMIGVGKKTFEKLLAMNIKTIGDLANYPDMPFLIEMLGSTTAQQLKSNAFGNGSNEIDVNRFNDVSSISNSQTLDFDEYRTDNMLLIIKILTNSVANRLEKHNYKAHTFTLQIKYSNFKVLTRAKTLDLPTRNAHQMFDVFSELFEEYYDTEQPVRLLGVSVSKLIEEKEEIQRLTMFDELDKLEKEQQIKSLINHINKDFGQSSLTIGIKADKKKESTNYEFRKEIKKILKPQNE